MTASTHVPDLVEAYHDGAHGLRNFSHQYRCSSCGIFTGGQAARSGPDLTCSCGATFVEVNGDCEHKMVRRMAKAGRYQCRTCSRILIERP